MKQIVFTLFVFFLAGAALSQKNLEIYTKAIAKAGSTELILQSIQPLNSKSVTFEYDSLHMSYVGSWSLGQSFCLSSSPSGDTVFVGAGAGVIIMDVTDPYNPVKISEIHARALIDGMHYDRTTGWLYLSAYFSGLEIWDISDITEPVRLSRIGTTGLPRGGVYVPETPGQTYWAYLVNVIDGIDVFSVNIAGQPTFFTNQNFTGSALIWNSFGTGDTLFLAAGSSGTRAIHLTNPMTNPFNIPGYATSIATREQELYVIDHSYGLRIYDYSSLPASLLGQVAITGFPYRVHLEENWAYLANSTTNPGGGIDMINISDPTSPQPSGFYDSPQTYITGNESFLCATGGQDGFLVLDVSFPANPAFASAIPLPISELDIAVQSNYAYTGNKGFRVFDVSDKNHPVQVGYEETDGALVKLYGNLAVYCPKSMGSGNKVNIMDISNPAMPVKLGQYNPPVMTYDLDLKGYYAYVACWWDGIRVVDYSNPASPVLAAHVMGWVNGAIPGEEWLYCQALDIEGDFLYAIDYGPFQGEDTRGLYIFDITDPASPQLIKRFTQFQGTGYDIEVSNSYAYIADADGGLSVVSVLDPFNPVQASYLSLVDVAWAVDVFAGYAFVADYINGGVQVINVNIPSMPSIAGYYQRTGCFALNVTYSAGHVFVADGPAGMQIYQFDLLSATNASVSPEFALNVYPNPSDEVLYLEFQPNFRESATVTLCDLQGRLVKRYTQGTNDSNNTFTWDVSNLRPGIYLVNLLSHDNTYSKKIVIK